MKEDKKKVTGYFKTNCEAGFIWREYIKPNEEVKNLITKCFLRQKLGDIIQENDAEVIENCLFDNDHILYLVNLHQHQIDIFPNNVYNWFKYVYRAAEDKKQFLKIFFIDSYSTLEKYTYTDVLSLLADFKTTKKSENEEIKFLWMDIIKTDDKLLERIYNYYGKCKEICMPDTTLGIEQEIKQEIITVIPEKNEPVLQNNSCLLM
jgi:hypothetical protein